MTLSARGRKGWKKTFFYSFVQKTYRKNQPKMNKVGFPWEAGRTGVEGERDGTKQH